MAIIKSRKIIEQLKQVTFHEKAKMVKKQQHQQEMQGRTNRELLLKYMYDRAEEVLILAESQFPNETRTILNRLINLIKCHHLRIPNQIRSTISISDNNSLKRVYFYIFYLSFID
jgi:hypothetical protein